MSKKAISSGVTGLLDWGSPTTVAGFIIAFIIDTFKRIVLFRQIAHIFIKMLERRLPSIANDYSATTPVFISGGFAVVTALLHVQPSPIYSSAGHTVSQSVPSLTPTRPRSNTEDVQANKPFFATNTTTFLEFMKTTRVFSFLDGRAYNSPASQSRANYIHGVCTNLILSQGGYFGH